MNVPALVVWLVDGDTNSQRRVNSVIQPVSMRLPAASKNELLRHIIINVSEIESKDTVDFRVGTWLDVSRIGQWQADGDLSEQYTLQVIVVPMADTITAKFLESFADKVVNHIRGVPSLAIVPLRISLVWYVSDRAWTSMQLKQYWPRICISNRANDWMTSIETIIVSLIASGLGTWIDAQQEELSKTHKDVDVLWMGSGSLGIGQQVIHNLMIENIYRRLVSELRDDKITSQEIDESVRVAEAQKRAYVRSIASGVQQEFSEYFEWILDYEETSSVTAPIRVVNQSNEQSTGLYLRKDSTLAQRLFGRDTVWWQSADNDFSQLKMFSELLRKDSKPDEVQEHARIMSDLATHFTNVHARMSEVIAEASQTSEKSFFEQVFEKVKYKSDYGIRDIQQNIADYIEALLHADVFEFNGSTVVESPTDLDSYFKELADKVTHQLDTSIQKMTRRRQTVYSVFGGVMRLFIALPLLVGLGNAFVPADYKSYVDIGFPLLLAIIGIGSMVYWYYQYHVYAREVRASFLNDVLGRSILGIVKMIFLREKSKQINHLQQMQKVYAEVIKSFDDQQVEALKPVDDVKINKWFMHQLSVVFGTHSELIDVNDVGGDEIQGVVGETVGVYDFGGIRSLSLVAKTVSLINRTAEKQGFPHGRIFLLQDIASRMSGNLFTREGILDYIHEFCERFVKQVMHNSANGINVFVVLNDSQMVRNANNVLVDRSTMFKDGIHWNWLYTAANPNLIPRPSINRGVEVKRYDIVLLAEQLQPNMITLIGRHNEYWRDSFIEVSHRLTNELTMLRLDMDVIERKGDKK